ncbi:hypothetical protein [Brucella sp. 2716]|uniref:hypothetical protein n=1 Tax=Brucella sp. 2716 TaxID=2975052 RepID=UPI00217E15DF|nr:hypothetical protein [Brucella sp. 2716]UWF60328.1 hypothetical protein NYO66_15165 [Brucella sp. 2716]
MSDPIFKAIDRGNAAVIDTGIILGVELITDPSDNSTYQVLFRKESGGNSNRHIIEKNIDFTTQIISNDGQSIIRTAYYYVPPIQDSIGDTLVASGSLYKDGQLQTSFGSAKYNITFIATKIPLNQIVLISQDHTTYAPSPGHDMSTPYTDDQVARIDVILDPGTKASMSVQDKLGIDIQIQPIPDIGVNILTNPGDSSNAPALADRMGSYFTVVLGNTDIGSKQSLYLASESNFLAQAYLDEDSLSPPMIFLNDDETDVYYAAPHPHGLQGGVVSVPNGQTNIYFDIDASALTTQTETRIFWMASNGNKIIYPATDTEGVSNPVPVPISTLQASANPADGTNQVQFFVEFSDSGTVSASSYGHAFTIDSQFNNQPPEGVKRVYFAPLTFPTPSSGIPNLIDLSYILSNNGYKGQADGVWNPIEDLTVNVYLNGWDSEGNPQATTLHPMLTNPGNDKALEFTIPISDLIGYGEKPVTHEFSTIKVEYFVSNVSSKNYGNYSKLAIYKLDTVQP